MYGNLSARWEYGRGRGAPHFPAMASGASGLETPPGNTVASPARSTAWPKTASLTRQDCQIFLKNRPAIYGMWLVTLLLLYSLHEGKKNHEIRSFCMFVKPIMSHFCTVWFKVVILCVIGLKAVVCVRWGWGGMQNVDCWAVMCHCEP
jgi:hypothetical protein